MEETTVTAHDPAEEAIVKQCLDTSESFTLEDSFRNAVRAARKLGQADKQARIDELLQTVAKISKETPFDDEVVELRAQVAALIAEIGTLRAAGSTINRINEERFDALRAAQERVAELETDLGTLRQRLADLK